MLVNHCTEGYNSSFHAQGPSCLIGIAYAFFVCAVNFYRLLLPSCTLKIYSCIMYLLVQDQIYPWFLLSLSDPTPLTAYQSTVPQCVVSFYALYLEVIIIFFPNLTHEQGLVLPTVSYDPLMVLHCMALLLLFHCLNHFHLNIVHIYSGVVTLVRLLDPENGGIMLMLIFVTVYQSTWHNMHIHVLCSQYQFSSSSLPSFNALSPFTKHFLIA